MTAVTVSELAATLKETLEGEFPAVWVAGEIAGVSRPASGHIYFNIKDAGAVVACVAWKGTVLRLKAKPENGVEVFLRGQATYYAGTGKCQLIVSAIEPKGLGAAELALKALLEKLAAKGYFRPERKRPLPAYPTRVGLVTSSTGAAVRDMLELFARRWPVCEIVVVHARVQGETAAAEIAAAINLFAEVHDAGTLPFDAVVVGRGGGSSEDLSAFNAEVVADAIFAAPFPVVSAVGHEIDVTVADRVADVRAETPTAAVELLTPNRVELLAGLEEEAKRMRSLLQSRLKQSRRFVDQLAARPVLRDPLDRLRVREQKLDDLETRLRKAAERRIRLGHDAAGAAAGRLQSLSPLNVLARGYSLTLAADGTVVKSAAAVGAGDVLTTRTADGTIRSRVEPPPG